MLKEKAPMWTKKQRLDRSTTQAARALALWEVERLGLLNFTYGSKRKLAKRLKVSPMTLDRTLAVLNEAKLLAKELKLELISDTRLEEMTVKQRNNISFEQYQQTLKDEGLVL